MANLDSYHPFRNSVQTGSSVQNSNDTSDTQENKKTSPDDIEYKPWLSWKTKFRLLIGGFAVSALFYVTSYAISLFEEEVKLPEEPSMLQEMEQADPRETVSEVELFYDKTDLNERGRSVHEARKKAGFFKSFFCMGGKRSGFCD